MTAEAGGDGFECTAGRPRSVYVIDDDPDIRKSIHFLLLASSIRAWPFARADDFLDQLQDLVPAPIMLDLRMPDIDGLHLLEILRQRRLHWPVIVMTAHGDIPAAVRAMKLGAIEFLEKPFRPDVLDQALALSFDLVDRTMREESEREVARRLVASLTPREREVVATLTEGVQNKIVAHRLGISARTVEHHRANALVKLGVKSIAEVLSLIAAADHNRSPGAIG
jgi:two-component system response regulator FixJ